MNFLKGRKSYLSGPIENDVKEDWRTEPKRVMAGLGLDVIDPFADPKQQWVPAIKEARAAKDYERITEIAKRFVRKDLCLVDRSDLVVVHLPHKVPTYGTVHEIINSVNAKKPVFLICPQGKELIPVWFYGIVPHHFMFGSWSECFKSLEMIDLGKWEHAHDHRLDYIYGRV